MTREEEFRKMCEDHDLTYTYSDDSNAYRRGSEQKAAIKAFAAKYLSYNDMARIWNEVVDTKLAEGFREGFYWK